MRAFIPNWFRGVVGWVYDNAVACGRRGYEKNGSLSWRDKYCRDTGRQSIYGIGFEFITKLIEFDSLGLKVMRYSVLRKDSYADGREIYAKVKL